MNEPITGTTNEMAKQRTHQAAERTLCAWIVNSLTIMGLGIAFNEIVFAVLKAFPHISLVISQEVADKLGLSSIAFGITLLIIAMVQYKLEIKSIQRDEYLLLSSPLIIVTASGVFLFGIIAAIIILLKSFV